MSEKMNQHHELLRMLKEKQYKIMNRRDNKISIFTYFRWSFVWDYLFLMGQKE